MLACHARGVGIVTRQCRQVSKGHKMQTEYTKLIELIAKDSRKIDVINGLIIAQALCARKLIEGHDQKVLDIMGDIVSVIEEIKVG